MDDYPIHTSSWKTNHIQLDRPTQLFSQPAIPQITSSGNLFQP
jgi:hypothetical protein